MNIVTHPIQFAGEDLILMNQRAISWPAQSTLILSDFHLGKAAHFRKHGIAIPTSVSDNDLFRLEKLIEHTQAKKVLFVGDLVHAKSNTEVERFKALTITYATTEFILIQGNHDKLAVEKLKQIGISGCEKMLQLEQLIFSHQPLPNQEAAVICGHIHPGIRIFLPDKKVLKLPCFVVAEKQLILPAFSLFTGLDTRQGEGDVRCYAFDEGGFYLF